MIFAMNFLPLKFSLSHLSSNDIVYISFLGCFYIVKFTTSTIYIGIQKLIIQKLVNGTTNYKTKHTI